MASNLTLSNPGAVSFKNHLLGSRIFHITNEDPRYPASNLIQPSPFEKYKTQWKLNTTFGSYFRLGFQVDTAFTPTVFAIIHSNITATSANWVRIGGVSGITSTSPSWQLTTLPFYNAHNNIWIYFIDPTFPDSGSYSEGTNFVFDFYPNDDAFVSAEEYFEFGTFWLGTYRELGVAYGSDADMNDTSIRSKTEGGHIAVDSNTPYYSGSISLENRPGSERRDFISNYRSYGNSSRILMDIEANTSDDGIRGHGQYYCRMNDKVQNRQLWGGYSDLKIDFEGVPTK